MKKTNLIISYVILSIALCAFASAFNATGGTLTYDGSYQIHTFTSNANFVVTGAGDVEVLVVAGGGGGSAGGGGAGGLIYNSSYPVTTGTYSVTIGSGGAGGCSNCGGEQTNGTNSTFATLSAVGGGASAGQYQIANNGGSGGGGAYSTGGTPAAGSGTAGQGNAGGTNGGYGTSPHPAGGGGGAGAAGSSATSNTVAGAGGIGRNFTIRGTGNVYYAGGGGGSCWGGGCTAGSGGSGGGGSGSAGGTGSSGTSNTGGGGGGGGGSSNGGSGGSGIVIIRFLPNTAILPANETIGREAILTGISESEASAGTTYTDKQVYLRLNNGTEVNGTVDIFMSLDSLRWGINYRQNSSIAFPTFYNITGGFYILEMTNMTNTSIISTVSSFINATH